MLIQVLDAMIWYGLIGAALGGVFWKITAASRANRLRQQAQPEKHPQTR